MVENINIFLYFSPCKNDLHFNIKWRSPRNKKPTFLPPEGNFRTSAFYRLMPIRCHLKTICPPYPFIVPVNSLTQNINKMTMNHSPTKNINDIAPRIGMCYAIMMQTRDQELSLVQRMNTILLAEGNARKVFILCRAVERREGARGNYPWAQAKRGPGLIFCI